MPGRSMLQAAVGEWCRWQWGSRDPMADGLAIAEEAGEVCRAILKRSQVARGTSNRTEPYSHWERSVREESADVVIALLALADNEGFDLMQEAMKRFEKVRERRRTE